MVVEEKTCRLCWGDEDDGPLVQPCACCGSAKWIHEHCLEQWRRTSSSEDAAFRCGQCRDEYRDALSVELLSARPQAKRTNGKDTSGKCDKAAQLSREEAEVTRATLASMSDHGLLLYAKGDYAAAEPLFRQALKVASKTYGSRHPDTLMSINHLGGLLYAKGDLAAAESLFREALKGMRDTLGNRHPDTLMQINNLGVLLLDKGKIAAAEPLYREAVEVQRETLGNRHESTLISIGNLGLLLVAKGDLAAAEPLCREALEVSRETLGSQHRSALFAISSLGALLYAKGDLAAAEPLFREALKGWRETLGNRHPNTLSSIKSLSRLLKAKKGKLRPAEKFCGTARSWICGVTRSAVGVRARFAPRGASVAPAPSVGCS